MPTETERMLTGELYDPGAPELAADRRQANDYIRRYNATSEAESTVRAELLDTLFGSVGDDIEVTPPVYCDYGYNIHVGDGFFANYGCVFLDTNRIEFGDRCLLGPGVHVYAPTHPIDPEARATGRERGLPISVGNDVWIGGRAVLNPGVTVGDGSVVASGAVVTDDVPARVVVGGNPAQVLRDMDDNSAETERPR